MNLNFSFAQYFEPIKVFNEKLYNSLLKVYFKSFLYKIRYVKLKNWNWIKDLNLEIKNNEGFLNHNGLEFILLASAYNQIPLSQLYLYHHLYKNYDIPKYYVKFWDDLIVFQEMFVEKRYDKVFDIKPGHTIMDVGSSAGWYSIKNSRKVGQKGKIIALEPNSINFQYLKKNIQLNNCKNIIPLNVGTWSYKTEILMSDDKYGSRTSLEFTKNSEMKKVKVDTIDNIIDELDIEHLDIIQMDIEGAEIETFKGMKKTLKKFKSLKLIIAAYHEINNGKQTYELLVPFLKKYGFKIYQKYLPIIYAKKN